MNVTLAETKIVDVCLKLNEVNALAYEAVVNVLTALTNCSVSDFVKLFDFLMWQARRKPFTLTLMKVTHLSRLRPF